MKAEQRHQLHKNALASGMNKLVQESKSSASMVIGVLVLIVAVILAYWWWTSNASNIVSQTWINWWDSRSSPMAIEFMPDTELKKIAEQARGSAADSAAQLTLADQLYEKGYQTTFKDSASAAVKHFEEAYNVYDALSKSASSREIALRALIGAARCQESMGDITRAAEVYQRIVDRYGSTLKGPNGAVHPLVADAQERLESLRKGDGLAFYGEAENRKPWPLRLPRTNKAGTTPMGEVPPPPPAGQGDAPPPPPVPEGPPPPEKP